MFYVFIRAALTFINRAKMNEAIATQSVQVLLLDYEADKENDPKVRIAKSLEAKIKRDRFIETQQRNGSFTKFSKFD